MTFVFFQNCVSPHQMPYIKELHKFEQVSKVYLFVPRVDYDERKDLGWSAEGYLKTDGVEVCVAPSDDMVDRALKSSGRVVAVFNGIRADADVFRWFKYSLNYDVERALFQEPPFTFKYPLWLHKVRFFFQDKKYVKHFKYMLAVGPDAANYFQIWSKDWKIVPFMYCTEMNDEAEACLDNSLNELRLCFVGALTKRKNLSLLLKAQSLLKSKNNVHLEVVGGGEQSEELKDFVKKEGLESCVTFKGVMPMRDIDEVLKRSDVLVLPSLHDGWGAVVNEALSAGTYVVVSDKCGVRALIQDKRIGLVFKSDDMQSLCEKLQFSLVWSKKNEKNFSRTWRREWARQNISGKAVAKRLLDALT